MKLILILLIVAIVVVGSVLVLFFQFGNSHTQLMRIVEVATDAANEKGPHPPHPGHKPGDHAGSKPKRAAPPPLEEGPRSGARVKRDQSSSEEGGSTHHPKAQGKQKRAAFTL